jgi:hypothetical protein
MQVMQLFCILLIVSVHRLVAQRLYWSDGVSSPISRVVMIFNGLLALAVLCLYVVQKPATSRDLIDTTLKPEVAAKALIALSPESRAALILREADQLLHEPLDLLALSNLSVLKSLNGEQKTADAMVLEAARRSLRDAQTQVSAIRLSLTANDYEKAFYHFDGLLTSQPEIATSAFQALLGIPKRSEVARAMANLLLRDPPWRNAFMNWVATADPSGLLAYEIFNNLKKRDGKVQDWEIRTYFANQFIFKNHERAYFVWLDSLTNEELKKAGGIFDGDFDLKPRNLLFDWTIDPISNVDVGVAARPEDVKNKSLRLLFFNSTKPFGHVYQFLRLPAGKHTFNGEWTASNLRTPAGLFWTLSCIEGGGQVMQSESFAQSAPWSRFKVEISIPEANCQTQMLRLVTASNAVLDAAIDGEIRFDSLKISSALPSAGTDQP